MNSNSWSVLPSATLQEGNKTFSSHPCSEHGLPLLSSLSPSLLRWGWVREEGTPAILFLGESGFEQILFTMEFLPRKRVIMLLYTSCLGSPKFSPSVVARICNLRTQEAEAVGWPHVQEYVGTTKIVRAIKQGPDLGGRWSTKLYQRDKFFWGAVS